MTRILMLKRNKKIREGISEVGLHLAEFLGKTQTVSTSGDGLKFPTPKSWVSSLTAPSATVSATRSALESESESESDCDLATTGKTR